MGGKWMRALAAPALVVSIAGAPFAGEDQELVASDAVAGDSFGSAVSVSGNLAVIGAPRAGSNAGTAYVFVRAGTSWSEQDELTPGDLAGGDAFGSAVALWGATALVGAPNQDLVGSNSGAAYVYVRSAGVWIQQQKLAPPDAANGDLFGNAVAIDGTTAVVGARSDDTAASSAGSVYVYVRSGTTWSQQAELTASDAAANDDFGSSVAISGDTIAVGARFDDDGASAAGAVYVFVRSGTVWSQQAKLLASDVGTFLLGTSVAIDGDTVVSGAVKAPAGLVPSAGAAYVYVRSGTSWSQQQKLVSSPAVSGDNFGSSVSVQGDLALIGASLANGGASHSGAAYVFVRNGTTWTRDQQLSASPVGSNESFGLGASLSDFVAIVGAPFHASGAGAAYVFRLAPDGGPGGPVCFGTSCPCGNDDPVAGCVNSSGAGGALSGSGSSSVTADDLVLVASGIPRINTGLFFTGDMLLVPPVFVGDGLGCTGGLSYRYFPQEVSAVGTMTLVTPIASAPVGLITPGSTRQFQAWHRDVSCGPPPAPCPSPCGMNSNLTNAYEVTFTP